MSKFRIRPDFILHFVLWVVLTAVTMSFLIPMTNESPFGISFQQVKGRELLRIQDFPFHFNFVQKAWRHQTTVSSGLSIYSTENHLKVTSEWAGREAYASLHFGYSPTMLWVLAPLVPFSHATAFLIFNIAGLLAAFWMTHPERCRRGIGLFSFFSPVGRLCFRLGQTALVTGAGVLFLAERTRDDLSPEKWSNALLTGPVLWALTAKPPIALSAAAVLLGLRRWRTLIAAGALTLLSTLIVWPLLGEGWMHDYIHLIGAYNTAAAGPVFSSSLPVALKMMANLRAVLNLDVGVPDDVAGNVSTIVWLVAIACIALAGLRFRFRAAALWSMSILSYLLFCPHVTSTEVLHVVIILVLSIPLRKKLSKEEVVLLVTLSILPFISPIWGPFFGIRLPLFLIQLALLLYFALSRKSHASAAPQT